MAGFGGGFFTAVFDGGFVWRICMADLYGRFVWPICMADLGGDFLYGGFW